MYLWFLLLHQQFRIIDSSTKVQFICGIKNKQQIPIGSNYCFQFHLHSDFLRDIWNKNYGVLHTYCTLDYKKCRLFKIQAKIQYCSWYFDVEFKFSKFISFHRKNEMFDIQINVYFWIRIKCTRIWLKFSLLNCFYSIIILL